MVGRSVPLTAGSHSPDQEGFDRDPGGWHVGARVDCGQDLVERRLALLLGGEAALDRAATLLGLDELATALGAELLGLALDPEAPATGLAALGGSHADVDVVLPAASVAPPAHVTSHDPTSFQMAR